MSQDEQQTGGEVVVHDGDLPEELGEAIFRNNQEIRRLQLEMARREVSVHRAVEEQRLMQELQTLDEMTLHKMEAPHAQERKNRMRISDDSLAKIIELQDAMKLQAKEEKRLNTEAKNAAHDLEVVETAIAEAEQKLNDTRENTGWDGRGGRPFVSLDNRYRTHQLELGQLEEEQKTIKTLMATLTSQIETLTAQIEEVKNIDDDIKDADQKLVDLHITADGNKDALASISRIAQRKEKMLVDMDKKDALKDIRALESEKRVKHSELNKQVEVLRVNERAIFANDDRLRKVEGRLLELEKVLPALFAQVDEEGLSLGRPAEVPDSETVSIELFNDAINDLQLQRDTLANRDERLEKLDAQIEVLERKIDIVHAARESQTNKAAVEIAEIDRERARLEDCVEEMRREFEAERARLENDRRRWEQVARRH